MTYLLRVLLTLALLTGTAVFAQGEPPAVDTTLVDTTTVAPPAPVTGLTGKDRDNDHGHAIELTWTPSVDDLENPSGARSVLRYRIMMWKPTEAYRVDTLRQMYEMVRSNYAPIRVYKPLVDSALILIDQGMVDVSDLPFEVILPEGINRTDAPAEMMQYVRQALQDTLAAMTAQVDISKDSVKVFRSNFLAAVEKLPEAFNANGPSSGNGAWDSVGAEVPGATFFRHAGSKEEVSPDFLPDYADLYYRVDAVTSDAAVYAASDVCGPVQASGQWYNSGRTVVLISVIIFTILTVLFVRQARKGKDLYVRPLAGIEAVDDAIGRATEMGKPILYVLGLGAASDIATIASFTILSRVAKRVAEYQTQLIVPTYDPIVMTVAQEVVKSSYLDAGRPDDYNEDIVYFVTQSQFAYVAAVNGVMLRQLPATNVYMGKFYAESLILAETGALAGSIQIAGTDEIAQIPFFVVACDYTLIGEELYAASAYLGGEPVLLGSLKAQDYAKALFVVCAVAGFLTLILADATGAHWLAQFKQWFMVAD